MESLENESVCPAWGELVLLETGNMLEGLPGECVVIIHPEVVRAMIGQVRQSGATPLVGDSPGVSSTLKTTAENAAFLQFVNKKTSNWFRSEHVEYPALKDGR